MFGAYRCYLALVVVIFHIHNQTLPMAGPVAVFGFFVLSGFVIARVLDSTYAQGLRGFLGFALNRILRLYPTYWLFLGLSFATYWTFRNDHPPTVFSSRIVDALSNLSMIDLLGRPALLIPPAWTISVELAYYLAMAALLGRSRRLVTLWWLGSLGYAAYMASGGSWRPIYFSYTAPTICFASGAMVHHYRAWLGPVARWLHPWIFPVALALPFSCALDEANLLPFPVDRVCLLYVTVIVTALMTIELDARPPAPGTRSARADRVLGDLAYPIFLSHYAILFVVQNVLFDQKPGWWTTAMLSLPPVLLLSFAAVYGLERPLQRYRTRVRSWARGQTPAP